MASSRSSAPDRPISKMPSLNVGDEWSGHPVDLPLESGNDLVVARQRKEPAVGRSMEN